MRYLLIALIFSVMACNQQSHISGSLAPKFDLTSADQDLGPVPPAQLTPQDKKTDGWMRIYIAYQRLLAGHKTVLPLFVTLNSGTRLLYKIELTDGETQGTVKQDDQDVGTVECTGDCSNLKVVIGERELGIELAQDSIIVDVNLDNSKSKPEVTTNPETINSELKKSLATWSRIRTLSWTYGERKGFGVTIVNTNGEEIASFGGSDLNSFMRLFVEQASFLNSSQVPLIKKLQVDKTDGEITVIDSTDQQIVISWVPIIRKAAMQQEVEAPVNEKFFCSFVDNDNQSDVKVDLTNVAQFYRSETSTDKRATLFSAPYMVTPKGFAEVETYFGKLRFKSGANHFCESANFSLIGHRNSEKSCTYKASTWSVFGALYTTVSSDSQTLTIAKGIFPSKALTASSTGNGWFVTTLKDSAGLKVYFRVAPGRQDCRMVVGWKSPKN